MSVPGGGYVHSHILGAGFMWKWPTEKMLLQKNPQGREVNKAGKDVSSGRVPMEYGLSLIKEKKLGLHTPYLWPSGGTLRSKHFWTF